MGKKWKPMKKWKHREKPICGKNPFFKVSIFPFFKVSIFCTFQCFHFLTFSHVSIFSCFKVFLQCSVFSFFLNCRVLPIFQLFTVCNGPRPHFFINKLLPQPSRPPARPPTMSYYMYYLARALQMSFCTDQRRKNVL
jgi:hypothetical protein